MARMRIVLITNRTTEALDCMFDGVPEKIPPGYKRVNKADEDEGAQEPFESVVVGAQDDGRPYQHPVEYFAAEAYKRQHPRMGTQDPYSVDARDTEYLLGVEAWGDDVSHTEQTGAEELLDRTQLPAQRQDARTVNFGRSTKDGAVEGTLGQRKPLDKRAAKEARKARTKQKALDQADRRARFRDSQLPNPMGLRMSYDDAR